MVMTQLTIPLGLSFARMRYSLGNCTHNSKRHAPFPPQFGACECLLLSLLQVQQLPVCAQLSHSYGDGGWILTDLAQGALPLKVGAELPSAELRIDEHAPLPHSAVTLSILMSQHSVSFCRGVLGNGSLHRSAAHSHSQSQQLKA